MMNRRIHGNGKAALAAIFLFCFSLLAPFVATAESKSSAPIGGRFIMTAHDGKSITDKDFRGRYLLISFGYTYCPDICPTGLSTQASALELLGEQSARIQPLFITVDPERDDVATMRDYVSHFHPRLVGLTGSPAMTARLAKDYRVVYQKVVTSGDAADEYTIDHTASLYLMDPDGKFIVKFAHAMDPAVMAERLKEILAAGPAPKQ